MKTPRCNPHRPAAAAGVPFSPLGWSALRRLGLAATACALLWAVVWWAL